MLKFFESLIFVLIRLTNSVVKESFFKILTEMEIKK